MNTLILEKAQMLVNLLKTENLKIATAESCTGGMVSSYITAVSGASAVFEMGVTSYSNRIKNEVLHVSAQTLEAFGAVSEKTAQEMAYNIRKLSNADIGISVTGVAGPTSQEGHPVGTVFIGFSDKDHTVSKLLQINSDDREQVRKAAVLLLLEYTIANIK